MKRNFVLLAMTSALMLVVAATAAAQENDLDVTIQVIDDVDEIGAVLLSLDASSDVEDADVPENAERVDRRNSDTDNEGEGSDSARDGDDDGGDLESRDHDDVDEAVVEDHDVEVDGGDTDDSV
jgi:hypothetical protein